MTDLFIDGFTEKAGQWRAGSRLMATGRTVVERECLQNQDDGYRVQRSDIQAADNVGAYSWGLESFLELTDKGVSPSAPRNLMIAVMGVRGPLGDKNWTAPSQYKRVYCFQVTPDMSFPVSVPIADAPWVEIDDPNLKAKLRANPIANINCNKLGKVVNWFPWTWGNKVWNHTNLQNHPVVLDLIEWMFQEFAGDLVGGTVVSGGAFGEP